MEFIVYTSNTDISDLLKYNIYISTTSKISYGVKIYCDVKIYGESYIGQGTELHSNVEICNSYIGSGCKIFTSIINDSEIGCNCQIKAFTNINKTTMGDNGIVGNFSCVNNSNIGVKSSIGCLVSLNNVDIGSETIIQSGVCCETDEDVISVGDNVMLAANTTIIKPVIISDGTQTKPNSVITKNIIN